MTKFICWRSDYVNYGFLSKHSLCTQPPIACAHETGERVKLQTGECVQIFYCTRELSHGHTDMPPDTKLKGGYIGLQRSNGPSCSIGGKK